MIDKFTSNRIHDAAQIVDVVSDFVTLKKRGVNYVGLCPFHSDSTPSFYVSPSKNICKCFACGEGGTAVQFIMKHEQVSYYEALRYLAKKYYIEIKERELSDEEKQERSDRESMLVVNSWAQKFFTSRLYETDEGKTIGLPYFVERGFREDTIRKFQLGYSLNKRDDLYQSAQKQGYNETYLLKTGLVHKRDDGKYADRFFGRVMFPIHTLSGKVVAFGGRLLGKHEKVSKYVNSPESEIYSKSNELYGIYFAKQAIVKEDKCFLVEGYTDVISMHQTGIENVVASSGTALTQGQIRLIHRFTNNITVLYDGDEAGIKAANRGVNMFLEEGMNVKIVLLPDGEDPDSFARSRNSFDFKVYIKEHEVDFIRFKTELLLKKATDDPIEKVKLIRDVLESIAIIPDNIIRSVYIKECSQLLEEREQLLIDEVIKIRRQREIALQRERERNVLRPTASADDKQQTAKEPAADDLSEVKDESFTETLTAAESAKKDESIAGDESVEDDESITGDETATEDNTPTEESAINKVSSMIPAKRNNLYRRFEAALIRHVIMYGERELFWPDNSEKDNSEKDSLGKGNSEKPVIRVAEYIRSELTNDDIDIQFPIYKQILDEAAERCHEDSFVATRYFFTHVNPEISELAPQMISSRYRLSKFFEEEEDVRVIRPQWSEEQQNVNDEARKKEKEREKLERCIVHDIFVLKNEHIKREIDELNKQIKTFQTDEEKVMAFMKRRMELDSIKCLLSRELGDRIVIGIGK